MNTDQWFSACAQLLILVENKGTVELAESVHVFRAHDWDAAFERALVLGRSHEQEYTNSEGQRVRWRLHSITTLDLLDGRDLDGVEVHARSLSPPEHVILPFEFQCAPESHKPGHSV